MFKNMKKKAFWWRLYYYLFTDNFEGLSLKEVLNERYADKDHVLVKKWVPEHTRVINDKQVVVRGYYKTIQLRQLRRGVE